jgi:hypothetical protein
MKSQLLKYKTQTNIYYREFDLREWISQCNIDRIESSPVMRYHSEAPTL